MNFINKLKFRWLETKFDNWKYFDVDLITEQFMQKEISMFKHTQYYNEYRDSIHWNYIDYPEWLKIKRIQAYNKAQYILRSITY